MDATKNIKSLALASALTIGALLAVGSTEAQASGVPHSPGPHSGSRYGPGYFGGVYRGWGYPRWCYPGGCYVGGCYPGGCYPYGCYNSYPYPWLYRGAQFPYHGEHPGFRR
jgi:hypothetical protein